jgi:hypothetical protein
VPNLFGETTPLRIVLHLNTHAHEPRFDWDVMATNPETGDLLAMEAHVRVPRHKLGPELAEMLLWLHAMVLEHEAGDGAGDNAAGPVTDATGGAASRPSRPPTTRGSETGS